MKNFCKRGHDRTLPNAITLRGACRECNKASSNKWNSDNSERHAARVRKWCIENKERHLANKRAWIHRDLSQEKYEEFFKMQNGRCAACKNILGKGRWNSDSPEVDHNHTIGCHPKVGSCNRCRRGILCRVCNSVLGAAQDDLRYLPDFLKDYIEKWRKR